VQTTFLEEGMIQCKAPSMDPGKIQIMVGVSASQFPSESSPWCADAAGLCSFEYVYEPNITDVTFGGLSPVIFPVRVRPRPITVNGTNIDAQTQCYSTFTTSYSDETLMCQPPMINKAGLVNINLTVDGQLYSQSSNYITFYELVTIEPHSGPESGSSDFDSASPIIVKGLYFNFTRSPKCLLQWVTPGMPSKSDAKCEEPFCFNATQIDTANDTVLECLQPKLPPGSYSFEITLDGANGVFTESQTPYTVYPDPSITSVHPDSATSAFGADITMTGVNFQEMPRDRMRARYSLLRCIALS
jgi:hypothetical protein